MSFVAVASLVKFGYASRWPYGGIITQNAAKTQNKQAGRKWRNTKNRKILIKLQYIDRDGERLIRKGQEAGTNERASQDRHDA